MQALIKEHEDKSFKPFTLEIKVESYQDLADLWHRFNLSPKNVRDSYSPGELESLPPVSGSFQFLWELLDEKLNPQDYE